MPAHQYELIYNCTPTQLEVALLTTLPAAGFLVTRAPIKATGWIVGNSSGAAGFGQLDFTYDGQYFLKFFGANPIPTGKQAQTGVPENNIAPGLVTLLNSTLLATLGAPVPPNLAVPPAYVP